MSAPDIIRNVSASRFVAVKQYGKTHLYGHWYHYNPADDTLVRDDFMRMRESIEKAGIAEAIAREMKKQGSLF